MSVGSQHFGSSAKTGAGVNELFRVLAERIIEHSRNKTAEAPKKRMNQRGALNVNGLTDFDPSANMFGGGGAGMSSSGANKGLRLTATRQTIAEEE